MLDDKSVMFRSLFWWIVPLGAVVAFICLAMASLVYLMYTAKWQIRGVRHTQRSYLMQKTNTLKSRDTVPLNKNEQAFDIQIFSIESFEKFK